MPALANDAASRGSGRPLHRIEAACRGACCSLERSTRSRTSASRRGGSANNTKVEAAAAERGDFCRPLAVDSSL